MSAEETVQLVRAGETAEVGDFRDGPARVAKEFLDLSQALAVDFLLRPMPQDLVEPNVQE